jgi:hypothetical protein
MTFASAVEEDAVRARTMAPALLPGVSSSRRWASAAGACWEDARAARTTGGLRTDEIERNLAASRLGVWRRIHRRGASSSGGRPAVAALLRRHGRLVKL